MLLTTDGNPAGLRKVVDLSTRFTEGIPSWMTTDNADPAATYTPGTGAEGGLVMHVPAKVSGMATLFARPIDLTKYKAVRLVVDFTTPGTPGAAPYGVSAASIVDGAATAGCGVGVYAPDGSGPSIRASAGGSSRYISVPMALHQSGKNLPLSLWLDIPKKTIHVGHGDTVSAVWKAGSFLGLGVVIPQFRITTPGPEKSCTVNEFSVTAWK